MRVSMAKMAGRFGIILTGLWMGLATASAQQTPAPATPPAPAAQEGTSPSPSAAEQDVKQIKLTDEQVQHFIAAQTDLASIASKIQAAGDSPDPALQAELEGIATKHGFGNFAELDDVAANISIVMAGLRLGFRQFRRSGRGIEEGARRRSKRCEHPGRRQEAARR